MPPSATSSSWVPCSLIAPPSRTTMLSASLTVDILWLMIMLVRPFMTPRSRLRMPSSVNVSTAESASSSIRIAGFLMTARAMLVRCFCPPERVIPRSPRNVSYPFGNSAMSCAIRAISAASRTSAPVPPSMP